LSHASFSIAHRCHAFVFCFEKACEILVVVLRYHRAVKAGRRIKVGIYTALLASLFGLAMMLVLNVSHSRQDISAFPEGTTNGVVGFATGHWTVYCVSNHTTNSFSYAGAKIELKTDSGWILDPALSPTEIGGWLAPPSRMWHDGTGIMPAHGSFHIFFNAPENSSRWRASLRFVRRRPTTMPVSLKSNPSALAAAGGAAGDILDRPRYCDVNVPLTSK
jgi:hypothetical protein